MEKHKLSDEKKITSVFATTGPSFLHEVYLRYPQGVTVFSPTYFYPMAWKEPDEKLVLATRKQYPKSWAVHHWEGMWKKSPRQIRIHYQDQHHTFQSTFILPRKKEEGWGVIEDSLNKGILFQERVVQKCSEILKVGDNVIEVGAYNGCRTIPFAKMVAHPADPSQSGKVFAFEPDDRSRGLLQESVSNNGLDNVAIYDSFPFSQQIRLYRINKFVPHKPHRVVWRANQATALAICVGYPLDALLVSNVALIYINASGEEYSVLQGAETILDRDRPILVVDIWNDQRRQEYQSPIRQDQVFRYLERLRYTYVQLESSIYLCVPEEVYQQPPLRI
jgi:FkbM family methyltransferase